MVFPIYLFSVLAAPFHIYYKLRTIQRKFLWGGMKREKKWALIALGKMCEQKYLGQLGLKDPQQLGQALAGKIFWRSIKIPKAL
jgi:hypothetical protein